MPGTNEDKQVVGGLAPERARAFLDAVHRNAERLSQIIDDLLDLARIEAGEAEFHLKAVTLGPAIRRATDTIAVKAQSKQQQLSVEVADSLKVVADARALDQILLNLLDNAVKYTPEGGCITARALNQGNAVRIEIQDDGSGIEQQHRQRLFERFYRIDPGRSREVGGTGLGLAIVKHLVGAMHGDTGFEPPDQPGSIFWFTLPLAR
ncbi:MAG: hypothetical protein GY930_11405 [bacterium]|nr:hypothetical protein [bacterium]